MTWSPPIPLLAGYAVEPVDQTIRTEMEVGSPRVRRRTLADLDHVSLSWNFSASDMQAFRDWFRDDIAGGSSWFDLQVNLGNGGLETRACRFVEVWKSRPLGGGFFNVTAKVEVR